MVLLVLVLLLLVVDYTGPRVVDREMSWRRQALRRVWVMLRREAG